MAFPLRQILTLADMVSKIMRDNFTDISNWFGDQQNQINLLLTPPAGNEVTNARDYHAVLRDRIRSASKASGNCVITGLQVTTNNDMTVGVEVGEALVDGVACKLEARATSGAVTAPTIKRYDIVCLNSDNTLSIVAGNDSADAVLPSVSSTQRALAILPLVNGQTAIPQSLIWDARHQGAQVDGYYFFTIQEAVNYADDKKIYESSTYQGDIGGVINIGPGHYFEEIAIGKSATLVADKQMTLNFDPGAKIYRPTASNRALVIFGQTNTAGQWAKNVTINGGHFYGNGKAGAISNIYLYYAHAITLNGVWSDGNSSSTLTHGKDIVLHNVIRLKLRGCIMWDRWWKTTADDASITTPVSMESYLAHAEDYYEAFNTSIIDDIGEPPIGSIAFTLVGYHNSWAMFGWEVCGGGGILSYGSPWRGQPIPNTADASTAPWSTFYPAVKNFMRVF